MASTMWSLAPSAASKSSVKGTSRSSSCFLRRCSLLEIRPAAGKGVLPHLVELVLALLGVVNRGLVAVVPEVTCSHETVAACGL